MRTASIITRLQPEQLPLAPVHPTHFTPSADALVFLSKPFSTKNTMLNNGLAVRGHQDGSFKLVDLQEKKDVSTYKAVVDPIQLRTQYLEAGGCRPLYCTEGLRFKASQSDNHLFLLNDTCGCPEFLALDLKQPGEIQTYKHPALTCVTPLPDGRIAIGSGVQDGGTISVSAEPFKFGEKLNFHPVNTMKYAIESIVPLSGNLLACGINDEVRILNLSSNTTEHRFSARGLNNHLVKTADNQLISGNDSGMDIWNINTWSHQHINERIANITTRDNFLAAVIIDRDNFRLQKIKIWDMRNWRCVNEFTLDTRIENHLDLSILASGNLIVFEKTNAITHVYPDALPSQQVAENSNVAQVAASALRM
jgi:WD40 repeat protein